MDPNQLELTVIILAGGAGTRFWPLSTGCRPKQLLGLFGGKTLLQATYERVRDLVPDNRILVMTNQGLTQSVLNQLPKLSKDNVIGEPERKDTSAAIAIATAIAKHRFGNPTIVVLTADHLIDPPDQFHRAIISAAKGAHDLNTIYTLGVKPSYPSTSYGYIELGHEVENVNQSNGLKHWFVHGFREKPDADTAKQFVKSGNYLWNSGMFIARANRLWQAFKDHLPIHAKAFESIGDYDENEEKRLAFLGGVMKFIPKISIDFGIMEKERGVHVSDIEFSWDDVGTWPSVRQYFDPDANGNRTNANIKSLDSENNFSFCENTDETVAFVGVSDLIVVRAGPRTLVVHIDHAEKIKELADS